MNGEKWKMSDEMRTQKAMKKKKRTKCNYKECTSKDFLFAPENFRIRTTNKEIN